MESYSPSRRQFEFERLDAYHVAVEFYYLARDIADELPKGYAEERDQLKRAALSILLNLCEGAGEFSSAEKARFYRMALRSVTECAALLKLFEHDMGSTQQITTGIELLLKLAAMLTGLANRFQD